ncbi:hypothetical protein CONLIGDRAFT_260783 [Coniochaeta ligniaria NRRL 30616]|uniref:Uncharacterized protein n=1 Tax=Coniochaeta ligniaria NRRL 30616 TaxID=1408157 RepID=A0A1J7IY40_9PEZI|nr:hypothetical protein CONLIGDRAFT_260783 [Coniochaeta ligniaria NRRL 30616]
MDTESCSTMAGSRGSIPLRSAQAVHMFTSAFVIELNLVNFNLTSTIRRTQSRRSMPASSSSSSSSSFNERYTEQCLCASALSAPSSSAPAPALNRTLAMNPRLQDKTSVTSVEMGTSAT